MVQKKALPYHFALTAIKHSVDILQKECADYRSSAVCPASAQMHLRAVQKVKPGFDWNHSRCDYSGNIFAEEIKLSLTQQKQNTMSLIKRNNGSTPAVRTLLSDFFNSDSFFRNPFLTLPDSDWIPAVNVIENEKDFAIELAAPGFNKNDFKVVVENGVLNISAEQKEEKEDKTRNYTRREFSYSSFSRSFSLPENANEENISAKYDDGVLKLVLAKKVPDAPKKKKEVQIA